MVGIDAVFLNGREGPPTLVEIKIGAAVAIFLAGIIGGLVAVRLTRSETAAAMTALANTLAGGVFLGAALMHMLPDAREKFESLAMAAGYPLFTFGAAAGFLFVLMLDKVAVPAGPRVGAELAGRASIYPYVLMLTLSIHSVITGIALGLEDHPVSAAAIILAVLAHKLTAAMALAISFEREGAPKRRARNLLWMFYLMTPLGVVLGTWWSTLLEGAEEALLEGIFDSLAAGTFLYIAIVDILAEEFAAGQRRWPLFITTTSGFAIMALVAVWT